jgi:hypothetical protein
MIKGHLSPLSGSAIITDSARGYEGLVLEGSKH